MVRVDDDIYEGDDDLDDDQETIVGHKGYGGRNRVPKNQEDNNLGNIKMKILAFQGKNDPKSYLEWEKKVELVFDCHNYSEVKKVKLVAIEFSNYAIVWWDQLVTSKRRNGERSIETWDEMKAVMRKRFVPSYYYRSLYQKLQNLKQGNKSVEDYHKEMEMAMIRANIEEDMEATMARFLSGLNYDIRDRVEMQHYIELDDMLHMATKVEQQLKKRGGVKTSQTSGSTSSWKQNYSKKEEKVVVKPKVEHKVESTSQAPQDKSETSISRNRDIKCFRCQGRGHMANQCPNKRVER